MGSNPLCLPFCLCIKTFPSERSLWYLHCVVSDSFYEQNRFILTLEIAITLFVITTIIFTALHYKGQLSALGGRSRSILGSRALLVLYTPDRGIWLICPCRYDTPRRHAIS